MTYGVRIDPAAPSLVGDRTWRPLHLPLRGVLMTHVGPAGADDRLEAAVELAGRSGTSLLGVAAEAFVPRAWSGQAPVGALLRHQMEAYLARLDDAERRFRRAARPLGGRARCVREEEPPHVALRRHANGADWVIAARPRAETLSATSPDLRELVLSAGLPVLVLSEAGPPLLARRIMVAFRDAPEVRRAVSAAMPLLVSAEEVLLTRVSEDEAADARSGLPELAARLAERGCRTSVVVEPPGPEGAVASLARRARLTGVDLIVAGAFGPERSGARSGREAGRELLSGCGGHLLLSA